MKNNRFSEFALIFLFCAAIAWFIYQPGFEPFLAAAGSLVSYIELKKSQGSSLLKIQSDNKEKKQNDIPQKAPALPEKYDDIETFVYANVTKILIDNPKLSGRSLWSVLRFYAKNAGAQFSSLDIQPKWFDKPLWQNLYQFTNKFLIAFLACFIITLPAWATVNSETIKDDINGIVIFCISVGIIYGCIRGFIFPDRNIELEGYSSEFSSTNLLSASIKPLALAFILTFAQRMVSELLPLYLKSQAVDISPIKTSLFTAIRLTTIFAVFTFGYFFVRDLVSSGWKPKIWIIFLRGLYYAAAMGLVGFVAGLLAFGLSGASFNPTDKGGVNLDASIGFVIGMRNFGIRECVKHFILRLFLVADSNLPLYHQKYLLALVNSHLLVKVGDHKFAFQNQQLKQYFAQQRPT